MCEESKKDLDKEEQEDSPSDLKAAEGVQEAGNEDEKLTQAAELAPDSDSSPSITDQAPVEMAEEEAQPVKTESVESPSTLPGEEPVGEQLLSEEPVLHGSDDQPPIEPAPEPRPVIPILVLAFLLISIGLGFSLSTATRSASADAAAPAPAFGELFKGMVDDTRDGIAVLKIYGAIQTQDEANMFSVPRGADQTIAQLRKLGKKDNVKAVVLRVNTPGGTVGASQEIYQEIQKLRKKGKKVVVSMADLCASGGVYISVAADKIVANPGTITGSVGVIISVPNFYTLMEKIGVKMNTVKSGTFKDIGSYSREMSDEEKALLQEAIDSTYDQFLAAVAEGRGLELDEVRKWADGRIFNGEKALEYKLVDQLGSLEDAIDLAQKLAGLEERHIIRPKVNPFDQFQTMFYNWMNPLKGLTQNHLNSNVPLLVYYPGWKSL